MEFCSDCNTFLFIKEADVSGQRCLVSFCNKCNTIKPCTNMCVMHKVYKQKEKIDDSNHLNKYKVHDSSLPRRKSKCPHCKKMNINVYEIKYTNNSYHMNFICGNDKCYKNWVL